MDIIKRKTNIVGAYKVTKDKYLLNGVEISEEEMERLTDVAAERIAGNIIFDSIYIHLDKIIRLVKFLFSSFYITAVSAIMGLFDMSKFIINMLISFLITLIFFIGVVFSLAGTYDAYLILNTKGKTIDHKLINYHSQK